MNDLINTVYQLFKQLFGSIGKAFDALNGWLGKLWWLFLTFVIVPITWLVDSATNALEFVTTNVEWLQVQVEGLGVSSIGDTFASMSYFLGILDNFVPVAFGFFVAGILLGLWIVCTLIRIIIRLIPTAG